MGYEIDFIAVGEESSGGDAIAIRFGNLHGARSEQTVIIIDGGFKDSGQVLVDFVINRYQTDLVDIVVSTHPDQDHISGLEVVLDQLRVDHLLMHQPWKHSSVAQESKRTGFASPSGINEAVQKSFQQASTLEQIAMNKGIPITEPFTGIQTTGGHFRVIGPSQEYYESLLAEVVAPPSTSQKLMEILRKTREAVRNLIDETLHIETLNDDGETSASNNSSVIAVLEVDGKRCLFTGDAGIPALERAMAQLESEGFSAGDLGFVQVPHHGSRRNVGPTVLNRMLGDKVHDTPHSSAFVSAPRKNPDHKHPAKKVSNAYRRRGYAVHATQGSNKWHYHEAPGRIDYGASEPLPFYSRVEDDSET